MTQAEVIKVMEKEPDKWVTTKELAKKINKRASCIGSNLKRLEKEGVVIKHEGTSIKGRGYRIYYWKLNGKC